MDMTDKLEIVNISDVGKKRPHNEDSTGTDLATGLVVLADGMGGYKAGEVASAIAVTTILHEVRQGLSHIRRGRGNNNPAGHSSEAQLLKKAIAEANSGIFNTARTEPTCRGMGTTVVVGLFQNDKLCIAHVGDSRLYRLRGDKLEQITADHSLIQELVDRGLYTMEQAIANTPKNLVTRALGVESTVDIDILEKDVLPGDIYLLCSDGLNDMVDDEEIRLTLRKYSANLVKSAQELVRMANQSGGRDNISVILVRRLGTARKNGGIYQRLLRRFS